MNVWMKNWFRIAALKFSGEHEAGAEGHLEGDVCQLDPEAAARHRHDDDVGPATVRHQLRKPQI